MSADWMPPGSLAVTLAARERIAVEAARAPDATPVVAWAFERRERVKGTNDWRHHGEGPFVNHRRDAPPDSLWRDGDLVFAVCIPREKRAQRRASRLDIGLNGALVLI
jgi:hypothetical protein